MNSINTLLFPKTLRVTAKIEVSRPENTTCSEMLDTIAERLPKYLEVKPSYPDNVYYNSYKLKNHCYYEIIRNNV